MIQHCNRIGNLKRRFDIMTDHDIRSFCMPLGVHNEAVDSISSNWIKPCRRLVKKDNLGFKGQGPGKADALLHAAAQV